MSFFKRFKKEASSQEEANDAVENKKRTRDEYEFQPGYLEIIERPPAPLARRTALALSALLIIIIIWSILGRLDINANATGQLIVTSRSKVIQSVTPGEITAIKVSDGQKVKAGDVLITLNPVGVESEIKELEEQRVYRQLERAKLRALLHITKLDRPSSSNPEAFFQPPDSASERRILMAKADLIGDWDDIKTNLTRIDNELYVNNANKEARILEVAALEKVANNIKTRLQASKQLVEKKQYPRIQYLVEQQEELQIQLSMAEKKNEIEILIAQKKSLESNRASYLSEIRRGYYDALNDILETLAVIAQKLIQTRERRRQYNILAPINGVVQQLSVHTLGGAVQSAQQLMVIVPEGALLKAEVLVLNKDVGFVHSGQPVEVKIDAFPYTRYGTIKGKVIHVSRAAVENEQLGLVFSTRVSLDRNVMMVKDKEVPLQAGMSVTAEIRTGDRRVIDYLLSPLQQYQSEALRER
ncbi:hemolysin D [Endozoicomonas sp. (ex Bugula neritina AB1)]|nr:hemolysin D [Endozoicomonas sp. (ex Bugula neritina AB1)]